MLLGGIVVLIAIIVLFVVPYYYNIVMPWQRTEAIETALTWGGLADLPENAEDISVKTAGSAFTREFTIEFRSDPEAIRTWVLQSGGLKEAEVYQRENGIIQYEVPGDQGAIGGFVIIDERNGWVQITMSWS